jgi:endonuclease/exonuclease/phosphatase (EEP) superfamily protein YafD
LGAEVLRSEIRGAVSGLALVAAFLLAAVSIDFDIPGQALLQTLRFHIAAALFVAVVVLFAFGAWKRGLLFLLVCLVSVGEGGWFVYRMQEARGVAAQAERTPLLKVLSFNILNDNYRNGPRIAEFVKSSGADVVMIMEASPLFEQLSNIAAVYPNRLGCDEEQTCDLMLLSKTPLINAQFHNLGPTWRNRLITAQTAVGGQAINVVAAHMVKPYFDWAAVGEARVLRRTIDELKGPVLLAGDFNAAPWSDNIYALVNAADLITGPIYPATWPVELGPAGVPIDNIFTRSGLFIENVHALDDAMGSNHRGLMANVSLARN